MSATDADLPVTFTLTGFSTVRREGIELSSAFTANVNAELKVGSLQETVTVTPSAVGWSPHAASIVINDNETSALSVSLPASATEGDGSVTGTITTATALVPAIVLFRTFALPFPNGAFADPLAGRIRRTRWHTGGTVERFAAGV